MIRVGITGGIGSGKSVACRMFAVYGVPVFSADVAARYVMEHDANVVSEVTMLLGAQAYENGTLNRAYVSTAVYGNDALLKKLNAISHPATIKYGELWMQGLTGPYAIKEAAIFFESGTHTSMDIMVGVFAPQELRIARAMARGGLSKSKVLAIMEQQMHEDEKMARCDYVLYNDDKMPLLPQVLHLHRNLLKDAITGN